VLKEDADELRRVHRSPAPALLWLSVISPVLCAVLITYSEAILAWSPAVYLILAIGLFLVLLLLIAGTLTVAIVAIVRWIQRARQRRREALAAESS